MRVVWKFTMEQPVLKVTVPQTAKVVSVATQDDNPTLWIELEKDEVTATEERVYQAFGTGHSIDDTYAWTHVGSAHGVEGWMVFHIYERVTNGS